MGEIFSDITRTIGSIPLVRLNKIAEGQPASILAKLEFKNPLGSVKDRIGLAMIESAERKGLIGPENAISARRFLSSLHTVLPFESLAPYAVDMPHNLTCTIKESNLCLRILGVSPGTCIFPPVRVVRGLASLDDSVWNRTRSVPQMPSHAEHGNEGNI